MRTTALTRAVPDSLGDCELTHISRVPIDVAAARAQHAEYERALAALGCHVTRIPAAHDLPDSVFLEDTAIVLDEIAVITRPGAESRRYETREVAALLKRSRPLKFIVEPGTLDGGDVLRLGRTLYTGVASRTNVDGVRQLAAIVAPFGYDVRPVTVTGCLHLKSAATWLAVGLVLLNPAWIQASVFDGCHALTVDPGEPFAANVLNLHGVVVCAAAHERTNARIEAAGLRLRPVDVSELAKAEGGVTCCSLIVSC